MTSSMRMAEILTSRWAICLLNGIILITTATTLVQTAKLVLTPVNDFDEIQRLLEGVSFIFVAYGVALEERDFLMKFFKLYPRYWSEAEKATDHYTHFYGLCILLLGLLMQVSVGVVRIPNTVLNTQGIEGVVFGIGLLFVTAAWVSVVRLSWVLFRVEILRRKGRSWGGGSP